MNNIQKKSGESILDYAKRLIEGKKDGMYDLDYVEMYELLFNMEISSTEARKRSYGILNLLEGLDREKYDSISESILLDRIDEQQRELKKERVKLQTEKLEYNRWIREDSRVEMFEDKICDAIRGRKEIEVPDVIIRDDNGVKEGILTVADAHFGREDTVYGLNGEVINEYNEEVFERRMWDLLEEAVSIIDKEGLDKINLFIMGDLLEGMHRISTLQSLQYGVTESTIKVSEFMARWIGELSKHVTIDVYSSKSNHCEVRPLNSRSGDFDKESFDYIIVFYLKERLKDNDNVKVHDAQSINYIDVAGTKVASVHGHNDRNLDKSIKEYSLFYNKRIDILMGAHYHSGAGKVVGANEFGNIEWVQVPSICSTDSYAKRLKKSCKSGSKILIMEEGKGKTVTYDITLD